MLSRLNHWLFENQVSWKAEFCSGSSVTLYPEILARFFQPTLASHFGTHFWFEGIDLRVLELWWTKNCSLMFLYKNLLFSTVLKETCLKLCWTKWVFWQKLFALWAQNFLAPRQKKLKKMPRMLGYCALMFPNKTVLFMTLGF